MNLIKGLHQQRGIVMMNQKRLSFQYEIEKSACGMTGLGGLPVYLDLMSKSGMWNSIGRHVHARQGKQGWTDREVLTSLIMLNLAGGDCVDDLEKLAGDEGFCRVLKRVGQDGLSRRARREEDRRWRKNKARVIPSASSTFRYLDGFHDDGQEQVRHEPRKHKCFIPNPNEALRGLASVNRDLMEFAARQGVDSTATIDADATLKEVTKRSAYYCYKHFPAYQPLNFWWSEQGLMLYTEFRDGNVSAGYEQLRVFKEALEQLPPQVKKVRARSDTAGYQHDLMRYCASGKSSRFGCIEFAFSSDVSREFKKAVSEVRQEDWHPMHRNANGQVVETGVEFAEVCFVPGGLGRNKNDPEYRYLATREMMRELELPGLESQQELPFPTMHWGNIRYKVFGIVTNMDWDGERLVHWLHERCGKSEEVHAVLKHDLATARMPSQRFGVNAAWWWIAVLAHNLNAIMKRHVLGGSWVSKRLKAIRFAIINIPGRVLEKARRLIIRLSEHNPAAELLIEMRRRIANLVPGPAG
jgi:hypothetical protein